MRSLARRSGVLIAVLMLTTSSGAGVARGQPPSPGRFSLTVSPARVVIRQTQQDTVRAFQVSNEGAEDLHVDVLVSEFSQAPDGRVTFSPPGPGSAASWVTVVPSSFQLPPGGQRSVQATITMPEDPEPGERQVGILFRVPPPVNAPEIAVSGSVGAELLIQVPGPVIHHVSLGPLDVPLFADGGPVPLEVSVENLGTVHRNFFRPRELDAEVNGERVPFPNLVVLRQATRTVRTSWTDPPLLCLCHVRVSTMDGHGHPVTVEATVLVFPLRLVLGILLAALGLLLLSRGIAGRWRRHQAELLDRIRREAFEAARRELGDGSPELGDGSPEHAEEASGPAPKASGTAD